MNKGFIDLLHRNYQAVFNFTGGATIESTFSMALQYTLGGRLYSGLEQTAVVKKVTVSTSLRSIMHGYGNDPVLLEKIAAKFVIDGNVDESIEALHKNIDVLKEVGFSGGYDLYLSALFVTDTAHAQRAKQLFDDMKRNQRFLTRKSDYPVVTLLTKQPDNSVPQMAQTIYEYYHSLRKLQFKAGDELQMLAQILTFYGPEFVAEIPHYANQLKIELQQNGITLKRHAYPLLGLLALNATDQAQLLRILTLYNEIIQHTTFKNMQNSALFAAVLKVLAEEGLKIAQASPTIQLTECMDVLFFSDVFFVVPKLFLENVFSGDFDLFQ